ncbi:MAG: hypothetical protein ATN36_07590 [Epulopiscium sp. Nele67-Bin005]|nr:MAG: hypothetical protein ATN36_07590 [Epulopiscium sp. Nele67-Bin005]
MRSPKLVLDSLTKMSLKPNYQFERLYRNFYNEQFYNNCDVENLINLIKTEKYQPQKLVSNSKNIQEQDNLVVNILVQILEAIYKNKFINQNSNPHIALLKCEGVQNINYFINAEVLNFNVDTLMKILGYTINDKKFLNLIRKFLKAGYLDCVAYDKTYSGTPIRGKLGNLLTEIYLLEYDKFIMSNKNIFYVRYKNKLLIGCPHNKIEIPFIKEETHNFYKEIQIISSTYKETWFLNYKIKVIDGKTKLFIPRKIWVDFLKKYGALNIENTKWISYHRPYLKDASDLEIFTQYNKEITKLYTYYRLAYNVSVLNKFNYIMKYSCAKTLANKYKSSVRKILTKYSVEGNFALITEDGVYYFYNQGFKTNLKIDYKYNDRLC